MIATLENYQTLKEKFNREVSDQLKMSNYIPEDGKSIVIQHEPIRMEIEVKNGEIESIIIISKLLQTPLYDEIFMALEKCLNCSSIKFYNAYQSAIKKRTIVGAENNRIKAVHDASNGYLNVKITREQQK